MNRNLKRYLLIVIPVVLVAVIIFILLQINSYAPISFNGVAYTINGIDVYEKDISKIVSDYRAKYNLEDDKEWNQAKSNADIDSLSIRSDIISSLSYMYSIDILADKYNIDVSDAEVDYYIQHEGLVLKKAKNYTAALNSFLESTLDERDQVKLELKKNKIWLKHAVDYQVSDESIDGYLKGYGNNLNMHKAYSLIVVDSKNSTFLTDLLADIKNGKLSFEDASYVAAINWSTYVYSLPYVVYYDNSFCFPEAMYKVISSNLEVGQVTDVLNYYGYNIIAKYEGPVKAPENVNSKEQLDNTVLEQISWQIKSNNYEAVISEGEKKEEENFDFKLYYPWFGLPY